MMEAKYIGQYIDRSFGQHIVKLEYEYRGMRYIVTENLIKGNEPLAWQHRSEQDRIDRVIEIEEKAKQRTTPAEPINLDEIWEMMGWN